MFIETYYDERLRFPPAQVSPMILTRNCLGGGAARCGKNTCGEETDRTSPSRFNTFLILRLQRSKRQHASLTVIEIWSRADDPMPSSHRRRKRATFYRALGDAKLR